MKYLLPSPTPLADAQTPPNRILTRRVGGVVALTVAFALAFTLLLDFLKFDQKLREVTISRLLMVAEEVRRQGETGLDLGLELEELEDMASVLKRSAHADGVTRLDVWDDKGHVIFSSAGEAIGSPSDMSELVRGNGGKHQWRVRGDELLIVLPLRDGAEKFAGNVALRATLSAQHERLEQLRRELLVWSAPWILAALLATLFAVIVTIRLSARGEADGKAT